MIKKTAFSVLVCFILSSCIHVRGNDGERGKDGKDSTNGTAKTETKN